MSILMPFFPDPDPEIIGSALDADDVSFTRREDGLYDVFVTIKSTKHRFQIWLEEDAWSLRGHRVNGIALAVDATISHPTPEKLLSDTLERAKRPQSPKLIELRCPLESRRLFGKLITPDIIPAGPHPLIEFSCSQCKRVNNTITMHVFDAYTGEVLATNSTGPWIRNQKSRSWYKESDAESSQKTLSSSKSETSL